MPFSGIELEDVGSDELDVPQRHEMGVALPDLLRTMSDQHSGRFCNDAHTSGTYIQ